MNPTLTFVRERITDTLTDWSRAMKQPLDATMRQGMKRITREVIAITPPASAGTTGRDAYNQGRAKIGRQMSTILAPVRLKGRRIIRVVFGRPVSPVSVRTTERHPDVAAIYRANTRARTDGLGIRLKNYRGAKYYVDQRKYKEELARKSAQVGKLASGWNAAALQLAVATPAWITRHGTALGGYQVLELTDTRMRLQAVNYAPGVPPIVRAELRRRIPYAMNYVERGLRANIDHVGRKSALASGLKLRTGPGSSIVIDI